MAVATLSGIALTVVAGWYVFTYETEEVITNDMVLQFSNGVDGDVAEDENAVARPE